MSTFEKLQAASYDGLPFLVDAEKLFEGRKKVIHDYVGSEERFVEDLGAFPPIFTLDMVVRGDDAIEQRNALRNRLNRSGGGTLVIPHYGSQQVTPGAGFDVTTTDTKIGEIRFKVKFYSDAGPIFPVATNPNASTVGALANDLRGDLGTAFAERYTAPTTISSLNSATGKIVEISRELADIFNVAASDPKALADVNLAIVTLRDEAQSLALQPATLGDRINSVFRNAAGLVVAVENLLGLTNFGSTDAPVAQITRDRESRQNNTNALNQLTQLNGVTSAFEQGASKDYASTQDLDSTRDALNASFDVLFEAALGTDATSTNGGALSILAAQTGLADPTERQDPFALSLQADLTQQTLIVDTFNDIRTQAFSILDDAAQDVSTIVVTDVTLTSAPLLTYQLYASLDRLQDLSNVNSVNVNLSHFEGEVSVFDE